MKAFAFARPGLSELYIALLFVARKGNVMPQNFYSQGKDADVVSGATNFASLLLAGAPQYGLNQQQATLFGGLATTLQNKYQQSIEPTTRSPVAVEAKNVAKLAMKKSAVNLAKIILSTPSVTNDQLVALGLMPRRSRSPVPPPTAQPGVDLVSVVGRAVTIHIHDSTTSAKRGKPAGTTAAFVYTFVGANYPADPSLWNFEGSTSKSKFDITFANTLPGGTQVWVCAAWINARQQSGPPSTPITTYLQGGGVSTESELKIAA